MQTAVLAIHLLTTIALISVILIQRSDSGGIAHLGTAATGGFMSARGAANLLTRTTAVLAGVFMLTSLTLAILASHDDRAKSILDQKLPEVSATTSVEQSVEEAPKESAN